MDSAYAFEASFNDATSNYSTLASKFGSILSKVAPLYKTYRTGKFMNRAIDFGLEKSEQLAKKMNEFGDNMNQRKRIDAMFDRRHQLDCQVGADCVRELPSIDYSEANASESVYLDLL